MTRVRAGAWIALLALAGAQAWATRFYMSPDGVSYMDLSDAVLSGHWRELLNAYWSPLYPALIGAMRSVAHPSPYGEFAAVHLLNFLLFAASLAGFEYFIGALREVGRTHWDKPALSGPWGSVGAYAIFGVFTLMMTPLTLPTPDLLVSAASLFVFGALLRLRYDMSPREAGVVLGIALAAGSLAKSFIIPWAGVCIVTAIVARRRTPMRPALIAGGIWLLAVVPWTIGLSGKYGHPTFGDTGRLTYVWYVNRLESPSAKLMPGAAATPVTDSILAGVAITPDAPGTNPVWYDPARWYGDLRPEFELRRQLNVIGILMAEYIGTLAPLFLVIAFWLLAAGRDGVAEWWRRTWPIVVPSLAALLAYSIVLVTTRYVAPFYMVLLLAVMCGARWPARIPPQRMLLAIGVPLILMVATPNPGQALAVVNAVVGALPFVWLARNRAPAVRIAAGVVGALAVRALQPAADLRWVTLMSVVLILVYWIIGREAEHRNESELTSTLARWTLISTCAVVVVAVAIVKYGESISQPRLDPLEPNANWTVAQRAAAAQMQPGAKVALIGSPFEAYWMRVRRMKIVAVVPPPRQADFNALATDARQRLYDEFVRAGAAYLVVQQADPPVGADRSWVPIPYIGWVRVLR